MWDVRRPYVPVYTLDGQDDSTAGTAPVAHMHPLGRLTRACRCPIKAGTTRRPALLWKDSEVIWSCTKKENLFQQRMSSGTRVKTADLRGHVAS